MTDDETFCQYVSSRGILKSCDCRSSTPISSVKIIFNQNLNGLKNDATIYVCSSAIYDFVNNYLDNINTRFILVSGDADNSVPTNAIGNELFEKLINNEFLVAWYAQNLVVSPKKYPKFRHLPIGLDYHTISTGYHPHEWGPRSTPVQQERLLKAIAEKARPFWERKPMAYTTFHFQLNRGNRREAFKQLPYELVYYEPERVVRMLSWKNQTEYAFVVSPSGVGLDCHRTWEAICLGCIPILLSSPLDSMFEDLPVLIVKSWTDVSRDLLYNTMLDFQKREFRMEKLTLTYWMDKIRDDFRS